MNLQTKLLESVVLKQKFGFTKLQGLSMYLNIVAIQFNFVESKMLQLYYRPKLLLKRQFNLKFICIFSL